MLLLCRLYSRPQVSDEQAQMYLYAISYVCLVVTLMLRSLKAHVALAAHDLKDAPCGLSLIPEIIKFAR